ncbi:hypothetical protein [Pantoea sp. OXWO6B1]|uniref:hypothetical protein n=1 Tax=Pantoea sp. OXWO6B1 TaxID=1835724 RepID=UPI0007C78FD1|nr:hypothetical protein [Pantoea sp. OXWO6B1]OAD98035.1 hypothetical protein A6A26_24140 [Pantoea sp. OXWO6B1]
MHASGREARARVAPGKAWYPGAKAAGQFSGWTVDGTHIAMTTEEYLALGAGFLAAVVPVPAELRAL